MQAQLICLSPFRVSLWFFSLGIWLRFAAAAASAGLMRDKIFAAILKCWQQRLRAIHIFSALDFTHKIPRSLFSFILGDMTTKELHFCLKLPAEFTKAESSGSI
jgi:hypothetical protein